MGAIWTNEGILEKVKVVLGVLPTPVYRMHLYVNALAPGRTNVAADFQDCQAPGYAPLPLAPGDWTITVVNGLVTAQLSPRIFNFLPSIISTAVQGYWVQNENTGKSAWAEQFAAPVVMGVGGGPLSVQIIFGDQG